MSPDRMPGLQWLRLGLKIQAAGMPLTPGRTACPCDLYRCFLCLCLLTLLLPGLAGCSLFHAAARPGSVKTVAASPPAPAPIRFENVAQQAGIDFVLGHQGRSPLTILETAGGGCAFLDYDQDGWPDILLVGPHRVALYHNEHNGAFKDVTASSGIVSDRYWMGCAVGDYDGDGLPDIFLTGYHCCALYHNLGGGKFEDVTREAGITGLDWSMSAVFADFNGDGKLDLFVSQYVKFDQTTQQICQVGSIKSACGPAVYDALSGRMFFNEDGRRFRAIPWKDTGKTWGALASDLLGEGRPALYLANDMMPGDLWRQKGGRWENIGVASATAYDAQGQLQGGMGVDSGDYDNDGRLDLLVTNFFFQPASLYHNDGNGLFTVTSGNTNLGPPTSPYVKFGVGFADLDNDGWLDIFMANGHVRDNVQSLDALQSYAQPMQLFHNDRGVFTDLSASIAGLSKTGVVGRGVSFADYDRDGRVDILVCNLEGHALLLHNVSPARHWLDVRLADKGGNRFGLGALVTLKAGDSSQLREIRTCGSVLSARDPVAHFGLGDLRPPLSLEIRWPDGSRQNLQVTAIDRELRVVHARP